MDKSLTVTELELIHRALKIYIQTNGWKWDGADDDLERAKDVATKIYGVLADCRHAQETYSPGEPQLH